MIRQPDDKEDSFGNFKLQRLNNFVLREYYSLRALSHLLKNLWGQGVLWLEKRTRKS